MEFKKIDEKTKTIVTGITMPKMVASVIRVLIFKFFELRFFIL